MRLPGVQGHPQLVDRFTRSNGLEVPFSQAKRRPARLIILPATNPITVRLSLLVILVVTGPWFLGFRSPALGAQTKVTPAVPYGGIYDIAEATVRPDPAREYRLVVDVYSGSEIPDSVGFGLHNVCRTLNLFAVVGVPPENLDVVLALHGEATYGVASDRLYREWFGVDNPNLPVIAALKQAGVRVTVCGQSLIGREIPVEEVAGDVEIATSMLTTVGHYQMLGYAVFRF